MKLKIVGVSGSPRKNSNTFRCLHEALNSISSPDVETEIIELAGLEITDCSGCFRCWTEGSTLERGCPAFDDDMTPLYPKLATADGYIFASPTYYGSVTGVMKVFMDRFLPFYVYGESKSQLRGALGSKPAAAIMLAGMRNDGIESALFTLYRFFLYHDMHIVSTAAASNYGVQAASSNLGATVITEDQPDALERDHTGVNTIHVAAKKLVEAASMLKACRKY